MNERLELVKEIKLQTAIDKQLSLDSLTHFIKKWWYVVESASPYVHGWHIDAICEHLEAVYRFELTRLIINMPPRHAKSLIVSVFFPAWVWAKDPTKKFVSASYSYDLAVRDGIKMRDLVNHPDFRACYKIPWKLRDDQNQKRRFQNTEGGFRFSTSVGGTMTGEGGDYILVDDPLSAKLAHSEVARENASNWWRGTMSTRANDPNKIGKVFVMQRLHENDLAGELIEDGGWDTLILPAEFDPKRVNVTSLGWRDPRKEEGELLWSERFTQKSLDEIKRDLGGVDSMAQLQQDPQPGEGGLFKREWWRYIDSPNDDIIEIAQFWDTAQKPGITNDFSVCATWARTKSHYIRLGLWRGKVETPQLQQMATMLYEQFKPDAVVIEDKSSGSALIQYLRQETSLPVIPFMPKFDKEVRASAATPTVEAGKCQLIKIGEIMENGKLIDLDEAFLKEHERFPLSAHDDMVDTTSMMVKYFNKGAPMIRARRL